MTRAMPPITMKVRAPMTQAARRSMAAAASVVVGARGVVSVTGNLAPGEAKCVEVAGKKIALFNLEGTFYAMDDTCTHRGGPLSEGEVSGEEVTCPWHGAIYNIKTGAVLGPPAPRGVASYPVRVQGSDVEVEV